jgi:Tfp pilus assembly protein FimV
MALRRETALQEQLAAAQRQIELLEEQLGYSKDTAQATGATAHHVQRIAEAATKPASSLTACSAVGACSWPYGKAEVRRHA